MRRRPQSHYPSIHRALPDLASPQGPIPPSIPSTQGDAIEPFLVAGGQTWFPSGWAGAEDPAPAGVQLVTSQYVPMGRIGFVKRIMVAPCAPPVLVDPWRGWAGHFQSFAPGVDPWNQTQRAGAQAGLWETPLAWEGYFGPTGYTPGSSPYWRWQLSLFPGSLDSYRAQQAIPGFSILTPASWYLTPDIPVPVSAYPGGIPGRSPNGYLSPQRVQAPPSSPIACHIQIPENTTICLWAKWVQEDFAPIIAYGPNGPEQPWQAGQLPPIWPLLPSVGSLTGYLQSASREATATNAAHGWNA